MTARKQAPIPADPAEALPQSVVRVASTKGMQAPDVAALMAQIKDLEKQLGLAQEERDDAQKAALAAAEAQGMILQSEIQEVATGKTVKVKRAFDADGKPTFKVVGYKDDGREILKPVWHEHELPTFFYKVDLPPVGGLDLKTNDVSLYHGGVYEFDIDTLRSVKERIYRLRDHDRNIHGSDENFYRKPQNQHLSARG